MGKLLTLALMLVAVGGRAAALEVAPLAAWNHVIAVADGCGINKYRDARGVCRRVYVFRRHVGRKPLYGACGGLTSHRVCNFIGQCWMECD